MTINSRLASLENIDAYSDTGAESKEFFHKEGKKFLRSLAKELGLKAGTFDVRSNMGGIAVSGEVTLHSETLYVQLSESCFHKGISILFRSCKGRKDYTGGQNHFARLRELQTYSLQMQQFTDRLKQLGNL